MIIANTRNSNNAPPKKAIVKKTWSLVLKKLHLVVMNDQLHQLKTLMWQQSSRQTNLSKKMNLDNSPTLMVLDSLQTSKENHYNPTPITNTLLIDSASCSGKRSSSFVD